MSRAWNSSSVRFADPERTVRDDAQPIDRFPRLVNRFLGNGLQWSVRPHSAGDSSHVGSTGGATHGSS